ncbi:MAG: diaminopimelate decarboxylase [Candidatus Adiutrix sp.]|jgi:diaminopimelate decarboxylase|nr:diaminopimelate decarboxylase [Candidatus Adiutrix sp.]
MNPHFAYKDNILMAEGVSLADIAAQVGTPAYVYSKAAFTAPLDAFADAFKDVPHLVCFAVKTSANLSLLRLVAEKGQGADIVSGGELYKSLKAGIAADKVVFSGVGKTGREMREALEAGIMMFNVESAEELALLSRVAGEMKKIAPVAMRLNPAVDPHTHPYVATGLKESKFGLDRETALGLYAQAARDPNVSVVGLSCHIGSQLTSIAPFLEAAAKLKGVAQELAGMGIQLKYFDMGGGLGVNYNDETPPALAEYAAGLKGLLRDVPGLTLVLEPGRYVSGPSGLLLTQVLYNKINGEKRFVVIDGAMNDLIRPGLYGSYHRVLPVCRTGAPEVTVDVVGPICESTDFLAKGRALPQVAGGDLLAVMDAGAYGFSMSSNYNARPRAAEALVDGDSFTVVKARETYADLVRGEDPSA